MGILSISFFFPVFHPSHTWLAAINRAKAELTKERMFFGFVFLNEPILQSVMIKEIYLEFEKNNKKYLIYNFFFLILLLMPPFLSM